MSGRLTLTKWAAALSVYAVPFLLCALLLPMLGSRGGESAEVRAFIFDSLRVPRVWLGLLAGGALAVTGAAFQVILRNPLAEPYTLGATGGAAVGAALAISVPGIGVSVGWVGTTQLFALIGSGLALGVIYRLARRPHGISMNVLLLAGVTISILCGGAVMFIQYLAAPYDMARMTLWLMGSLKVVGYQEIVTVVLFLVPGLVLLLSQMAALNHLSLGDEMAAGHGVEVGRVQRIAFVAGGLMTAGVVSVAGPIGFVGLIVPHAVRRLSGYDQRIVLPASFLLGGSFLAVCDTLPRLVPRANEMPVGVVTALIGGPLFIRILLGPRR